MEGRRGGAIETPLVSSYVHRITSQFISSLVSFMNGENKRVGRAVWEKVLYINKPQRKKWAWDDNVKKKSPVRGVKQTELRLGLNFLFHMKLFGLSERKPSFIFTGAASCWALSLPLSLGHQSRQCFCLAVYQYVSSPFSSTLAPLLSTLSSLVSFFLIPFPALLSPSFTPSSHPLSSPPPPTSTTTTNL